MVRRIVLCLLCMAPLVLPGQRASAQFNVEWEYPEEYIQFVPIGATLALPLTGVKAENPFLDRFFALGIGFGSEVVIVQSLKYLVNEQRPDGSAGFSFPSAHAATAFLGAELVRHEYGWGWGAGAYALAASTAVLRVCHDRHYWWDCVAGAGIGVLCANIGYWMLDPVKKFLGIRTDADLPVSVAPAYDPYSGAICGSLALRF